MSIAVVLAGRARRSWPGSAGAQGPTKIRYALGDVVGIDDLALLIAAERAKARGVEVEITAFKSEELATQAVINGQADVGQGTPYAALQKVNVPVRFFYQLSTLQFFPIVSQGGYKAWKDLDGQEIAVQGRGSGTEAIMVLAAKQHGIKYKSISYVPGSQVRARAAEGNHQGVDPRRAEHEVRHEGGAGQVPGPAARRAEGERRGPLRDHAFLEKNQAAVAVLLEELLKVSARSTRTRASPSRSGSGSGS